MPLHHLLRFVVRFEEEVTAGVGVVGHIRRSEVVKNNNSKNKHLLPMVVVDLEESPSTTPVDDASTHDTMLSLSLSLSLHFMNGVI